MVMRFLWPSQLNPEPTALTRFGRVLHWIATGLFALIAALAVGLAAFSIYVFNDQRAYNYADQQYLLNSLTWIAAILAFGGLVYLAGRAFRYIFSGE